MQRVPLMVEQQPSQEFRNAIDRFNRWVKKREKIHAIVPAERFRVEAKERPWKTRGWASRGTHLLQLRNATNELSISLSLVGERACHRRRCYNTAAAHSTLEALARRQ